MRGRTTKQTGQPVVLLVTVTFSLDEITLYVKYILVQNVQYSIATRGDELSGVKGLFWDKTYGTTIEADNEKF